MITTSEVFILNSREVNFSSLKAVFPYEHNFCDTFHSEFLSIVKWLRLLHRKQKKSAIQNLPGDIIVKVIILFTGTVVPNEL